ncbi:MAG: cytochrome C [Phycisphaeraceae bacterium]|nr:MAG: cytochrome C [Phycisphaeraceae bacterium]
MPQGEERPVSIVFPRWTNAVPGVLVATLGVLGLGVVWATWYYATPDFWQVGYEPDQPVAFSHQIHAGQLGIDCRHCHSNVEQSGHSNIPDTATCMSCHTGAGEAGYLNASLWAVHRGNSDLVRIRAAYASGEPIRWRRIHKIPDYAHFNHAIHVNAGISCYSCHGRMDQQEIARQVHSLSMGWCLDCHRSPEEHVVDVNDPNIRRITNLAAVEKQLANRPAQLATGVELVIQNKLQPPQHCGACHY